MGRETIKEISIVQVVMIQCHRQIINNHQHQIIHRQQHEQQKKQFSNVFDHSVRWVNKSHLLLLLSLIVVLFMPYLPREKKASFVFKLAANIPYKIENRLILDQNYGLFARNSQISKVFI